jgi:hypothetical protein
VGDVSHCKGGNRADIAQSFNLCGIGKNCHMKGDDYVDNENTAAAS